MGNTFELRCKRDKWRVKTVFSLMMNSTIYSTLTDAYKGYVGLEGHVQTDMSVIEITTIIVNYKQGLQFN